MNLVRKECNTEVAHHVVESRRGKFRHHGLRESVVWRLEEAKNDVVEPDELVSKCLVFGPNMSLARTPTRCGTCNQSQQIQKAAEGI